MEVTITVAVEARPAPGIMGAGRAPSINTETRIESDEPPTKELVETVQREALMTAQILAEKLELQRVPEGPRKRAESAGERA